MFPKKQTIIKSYQFKIINNQQYLTFYKRLVEQAATKLLADLWSENWIERLRTSKQKTFTIINEAKVQIKQKGKKIYLPSRVRRGIAERVGRIIRGQYKRKRCYDDCLKIMEHIGKEIPEKKLVRMVLQTYRTNQNYPIYKKVMIQQTIQMIKKWHKKLAIDLNMISYCQLVQPEIKKFVFPFGVDDGQAIQYSCDGKCIQYRIKLPIIPQPKDRYDWQWFENKILLPEKIQKKIKTSLNQQPKRPMLLRRTLKGGFVYFFLQFPWEFQMKKRLRFEQKQERALAVDLGLRNLATAVVCEEGKQLSKPVFLKLVGRQYQHIERLYKHIASIQKQQTRLKIKNLSEKESGNEERNRLYNKRNRLGEELAQSTSNILIQLAQSWNCNKVIIEDLRSYKPPKGRSSWSRRLSEWLRGRIANLLDFKCQEAGLLLQKVCPWNTSSYCPRCTKKGKKILGPNNPIVNQKGRWFNCPHCNFSANRDYVASLNIYRASFIDYRRIRSLTHTNPLPYKDRGTLRSTVPSGGTDMNCNGLVAVTG